MPNNRILYACLGVAIAKTGHSSADTPQFEVMKGVQRIGMTTNFTLEQIFELGQLELYANVEDVADVEVTIEKVIDGEKLLYLQAVGNIGKTNLAGAVASTCDVYLGIFADTITSISGQTRNQVVMCSGMQLSSVSYNYSAGDNAKESISLVGNNKFWNAVTAGILSATPTSLFGTYGGFTADSMAGSDVPVSGIVRRGAFNLLGSTLPAEVVTQGNNVVGSSGIQSISVSADFTREDQTELGRFGPYNKTAKFPFEVTTEFEVTATNGDLISVSGRGENLINRTIILKDNAGTIIDLGTKNKLKSVTFDGADTGGGNASIKFAYSTFNDLKVNGGGTYW